MPLIECTRYTLVYTIMYVHEIYVPSPLGHRGHSSVIPANIDSTAPSPASISGS